MPCRSLSLKIIDKVNLFDRNEDTGVICFSEESLEGQKKFNFKTVSGVYGI